MKEKTMDSVIHDVMNVSATAGKLIMALGMRAAQIAHNPKKVALQLVQAGEEFSQLAKQCNRIAAEICKIDSTQPKKIITSERPALVDKHGKKLS